MKTNKNIIVKGSDCGTDLSPIKAAGQAGEAISMRLPRRPVKISRPVGIAITIITLLLFTVGCEDVIVVDLNNADPAIVIEAAIIEDNSVSRVVITKSTDFYNPGVYTTVSGATILVNDSEGNEYEFNEISDGVYENHDIAGKSGVGYSIEVIAEGNTYDAISTMPNQIFLDSLSLEDAPDRRGDKEGLGRFYLHLYFQDQPNIDDYCRFKLYSNGTQLGGFNIYNDKLTDGNYIDYRLVLGGEEGDIKLGDIITVELQSIDKAAFDFYKTANSVNASGGSGRGPGATSAAPANPVTNWSNKALGFFSAYTVSKQSIRVIE